MRFDRTGKRQRWVEARRAEVSYNARLVGLARQVGHIIKGFTDPQGDVPEPQALMRTLLSYAETITPWAVSVSNYMLADVERRDARMWKALSKEMGVALRAELTQAPSGVLRRELMAENVGLIRSLPIEAAERVQELSSEALVSGRRADSIRKEIQASGSVTASRARLIARTEVSRAASIFTQARAQRAGSQGYIWHTVTDAAVRETHQALNGTYVRWDAPPKTDKNLAPYHAGCGPNCRCFAEPVFPDF